MEKQKELKILENKIKFCEQTGKHKKELKILKEKYNLLLTNNKK